MIGWVKEVIVASACAMFVAAAWWGLATWTPLPAASGLVDLRVDRTRQDHAIVVNMRDAGTYGHVRVSWFAYDGAERSTLSLGYYADRLGHVREAFDTVGVMVDELVGEAGADRTTRLALVIWVDGTKYDNTRARIERWRGLGRYELFQRDCVSFVADMIEPLGLTMPSRLFAPRPYDFLTSVMELNVARPST